jgi:ABC-type dipeptide/oligopeptide/nickel transport system permease component
VALAVVLISAAEGFVGVDVARVLLGTKPSAAEVGVLHHQLGLDRPLPARALTRVMHAAAGDLGQSYVYRRPVGGLLLEALMNSARLLIPSLVLGSVLGILLGIAAAYYSGRVVRSFLIFVASVALLPSLIIGTLVVYGLGYRLNLITPSFTFAVAVLALAPLAVTSLSTYQEYTRILGSDYTRAGRSFGVPEWQLVFRFSLRVAAVGLLSNITYVALYLLTGTVFVEIVFALPGLGNLLLTATDRFDFPVITGVSLAVVCFFGLMNALTGVALYVADPRTR